VDSRPTGTSTDGVRAPELDSEYYARLIEAAIKGGTLAAVALPAAGVLSRWVSYFVAGIPPAIAVADSLPALAYEGLSATVLAAAIAIVAVLVYPGAYFESRDPKPAGRRWTTIAGWLKRPDDWLFAHRTIRRFVVPVSLAVIILTSPTSLAALLAGVLLGRATSAWAASRNRVGFRRMVPYIGLAIIVLTISHGLVPSTPNPVFLSPAGTAALPAPGWYNLLGRDDAWTYAYRCTDGSVVGVPTSAIGGAVIAQPPLIPSQSLIPVIFGGAKLHLGFTPDCP
jgi:hypothetical protein